MGNHPKQNLQSSAQYDTERTSPEQNQQSSAQYGTERTSPKQNQQSSAQYDTERTSPEQNRPPENTRPKPGITKSLELDLQPQKW